MKRKYIFKEIKVLKQNEWRCEKLDNYSSDSVSISLFPLYPSNSKNKTNPPKIKTKLNSKEIKRSGVTPSISLFKKTNPCQWPMLIVVRNNNRKVAHVEAEQVHMKIISKSIAPIQKNTKYHPAYQVNLHFKNYEIKNINIEKTTDRLNYRNAQQQPQGCA